MNGEEGDLGKGTVNFYPPVGTKLGVASSFRDKMDGMGYLDLRGQGVSPESQTPADTHVIHVMGSGDGFRCVVKKPGCSDSEGLASDL